MNKEGVEKFVEALAVENVTSIPVKGWGQMSCPLARWRHQSGMDSNPSFGIHVKDGGTSNCHCFSCNFSGTLLDLLYTLKHHLKGDTAGYDFKTAMMLVENEFETNLGGLKILREVKEADSLVEFPEAWLESFPKATQIDTAMRYLLARGVGLQTVARLGLRYDGIEKRICFPVRDYQSVLRGLHGRVVVPGVEPKYRMYQFSYQNNPIVWLGEHWVDFDKPVVIVESVFDLAKVIQVYPNVISPLTASLSKDKILRIQDAFEIVLMFDNDKAGAEGASMVKKYLPKKVFYDVKLGEFKDPGEMSLEEIRTCLSVYLPFLKSSH
jgi:5S rRNA maturation endonuclease (ribonuclease M5)